MAKAETFQDLSLSEVPPDQELWRWLYNQLRAAILDGRLKRGGRMPSSRSLARQYGVSRGTVLSAFDQLHSEGYTTAQVGAGTFVASNLPDRTMAVRTRPLTADQPQSTAKLSRRAQQMIDGVKLLPASHSVGKAFRMYEPAVDLFPATLWARVAGRVLRRAPRSLYGQGNVGGYEPLRKAIAEYLGASRGVRCSPAQILVTSGAQQGLDLVCRMLLNPGDPVWLEDPGYPGAYFTIRAAGARPVPVPVDSEGLNVLAATQIARRAKLAYVTPSNQFPLGVTMSLDRRLALLDWAASANAWIVEDEYDAEYRYAGRPSPALQSLDRSGCVIYVGTFTKMLFNALRIGFLVLPERLVSAFEAAKSFVDRHHPTLDQAILAEFITEGYFGHHVRRMRQVYAERMEALAAAARKHLDGAISVQTAIAGMRTIGWLASGLQDAPVAPAARAQGLELAPLSDFTHRHTQPPALVLGFAGCSPSELRRGTTVLGSVLRRLL